MIDRLGLDMATDLALTARPAMLGFDLTQVSHWFVLD